MPAVYYTKKQKAEAILQQPRALGQFGAGRLSEITNIKGINTSVADMLNTGKFQYQGKTYQLVDKITYNLGASPEFKGRLTKDILTQIEAENTQVATQARRNAQVSPITPPAPRNFTPARSIMTPAAQAKSEFFESARRGADVLRLGGFGDFIVDKAEQATNLIKNVFSSNAPATDVYRFVHNPFLASFTTPKQQLIVTGAGLAVAAPFALPVVAGGTASGAAFLAANASNILRAAGVAGSIGLGYKGYEYLSSKIPPPSDTNVLQDAKNLFSSATDGANAAIDGLKNTANTAIEGLKENAAQVVDNAKEAARETVGKITGALQDTAGNAFSGLGDAIAGAVGGAGGELIENVKSNPIVWFIGGALGVAVIGAVMKK